MCKHKLLAHNHSGYVLFCKGCGRYQLAFGTSLITLEPKEYESFCEHVSGLAENSTYTGFEKEKQVCINIFSPNAMMVLNNKELRRLNILLDEAEFTRQIEFLLKESHIKQTEN